MTAPLDEVVVDDLPWAPYQPTGVPYLAPEVVLLYEAKHARPKDLADLEGTLPHLTETDRGRLSTWLRRVHPDHPGHAVLTAS